MFDIQPNVVAYIYRLIDAAFMIPFSIFKIDILAKQTCVSE